jgi:nucleoside transporter
MIQDKRTVLPPFIRTKLGIMMFLQYVVMGSTWPIMTLYLKDSLHFTGSQAGVVLSMASIAAFVCPIVGACIADRLIFAERLLSICHFGAAVVMGIIIFQTQFAWMVFLYLVYSLLWGPTVALTNAITFHNHPQGNKYFGNIRVWGTIGWITVAWGFGYLWLGHWGSALPGDRLPDALKLSAMASAVLGLFALTFPRPEKRIEDPVRLFPRESLQVLRQPRILLISGICLLITIVDRYYYFGMSPFLRYLGFADTWIMPVMSLGQLAEIAAMFLLAMALARMGFKFVLGIGILAELTRFLVFSFSTHRMLIIATIPCHGIAYAFFITTVYIYLDGHCDKASRAGLQQLFTIIISGIGHLSACLLGGWCMDRFVKYALIPSYTRFWLLPAGLSLLALILLLFLCSEKPAIKGNGK